MHAYTHTNIRTYIHTYIRTYVQIYIHSQPNKQRQVEKCESMTLNGTRLILHCTQKNKSYSLVGTNNNYFLQIER